MNPYIGHEQQLYGVTESRLVGGKGDGMRMLTVKNGSGLEFTISLDRCADVSQLSFKGDNFSYFAPCGYVAPQYYDRNGGAGFLRSFTAGFFTTCGLTSAGNPCVDDGEELPLHGTVSNIPCESFGYWVKDDAIHIKAVIRDAYLSGVQLILEREYVCPLFKNELYVNDAVKNIGYKESPIQIMYHCNMGYPLLSENAKVMIPASKVEPRNALAAEGLDRCLIMEKPQRGIDEVCYYHIMSGTPTVSVYNEDIGKGLEMSYDTAEMKYFTEWKMMGENEYVLGLEPGNCNPDGRKAMREMGDLEMIQPGATREFHLKFRFVEK